MNDEGKLSQVSHFSSYSMICAADSNRVSLYPWSELVEYFRAQMRKDPDMASAVAAIRTLLEFLKRDKGVFIPASFCYTF